MTGIGTTPTDLQINITKSSDSVFNFTCSDQTTGDPIDISIYEFYLVARKDKNIQDTKIIEILNADIAQSDSGSGTVDTFSIDFTNSLTDICRRLYYYEIRVKTISNGDNEVWFNGILNIQWTTQEVR